VIPWVERQAIWVEWEAPEVGEGVEELACTWWAKFA